MVGMLHCSQLQPQLLERHHSGDDRQAFIEAIWKFMNSFRCSHTPSLLPFLQQQTQGIFWVFLLQITLVSTGWAEDREVLHLLCSLLAYTAGSFHMAGEHWTSDPLRNKTVSRPRVLANGMQGSISKSKSLCSDPRELSLLLPEHFTTSCMLEMITERHNLAQC